MSRILDPLKVEDMKILRAWLKFDLPVVWRLKRVRQLWYMPSSTPDEILRVCKELDVEFTLNTPGVSTNA